MKRLLAAVALLTSLFAGGVQAQTTTTYYGLIKDLAGNPVTSGKITFTLRPSTDVTESGLARFTTQTITCPIASTGNVVGLANSNVTATTGTTSPGTSVAVASATGFANGQPLVIAGAGAAGAVYVGAISNVVSNTFTISPASLTRVADLSAVYTGCQVTMNTALQPQNSGYLLKFWPGNVNTATIFTYALNATTDISTVVSTQAQLPAVGGFLDLFSNQTIGGNKTFTGATSVSQLNNTIYMDGIRFPTLQLAANAVGNCGTLVIPPGTYTPVNSSTSLLVVPATETCFKIKGSGKASTILDCSSLTSAVACITNSNGSVQYTDIAIEDLTVKGPASISLDSRIIDFQWCVRCRVSGNNFINGSFGVTFGSSLSADDEISSNYMTGQNNQGISVSGTNLTIVNNHIYNVDTTNLSALHHGIYVQGGNGTLIANNHVQNVPGFCIQAFSQTTGQSVLNYRVTGNVCLQGGQAVSGTRGGIAFAETAPATGIRQGVIEGNTIDQTNGNPIYVSSVNDIAVEGNTIRNYTTDGILIQATTGFTTSKLVVTGNILTSGTVSGNGIRLTLGSGTALQNCLVAQNIIDTTFAVGIYGTAVSDCIFSGNRIKDYNSQVNAANAGILFDGSSVRNAVYGNIISSTTANSNPISFSTSGDSDNVAYGNILLNNATPTLGNAGSRNLIWGNKINNTDSSIPFNGSVVPASLGPGLNNWVFVDGIFNTSTGQVADAAEGYPVNNCAGCLRSKVIYSPPELITTNPFPPNFAPEWKIMPGSVHDTICDHTHIYCILLAVPALIGSQGTIAGVGPLGKGGDMSSGSLIMNDPTLFPPPMGIPSSPGTMTCTAGATTYDFAIRLVANLNSHAGGTPRGEGFGAYAKYHLTACAASGNTFAMTGGTLPSGTIANSLTPTEYEVGFSTTGANGPYFAQTAANLGCVAGNLGLATGVAYSCTIAGGSFSIAQANLSTTTVAFASDQKTGNPVDGSNPLLFFGTPSVSVSFNEQLRDVAVACQPTGHGANNPNILLLNFNGQEGAGASNGQTALYGDCGGYTGISGAMIYSASQTPNSSYSHMQISGGPTSGTVPFYGIIMDAQINGTGGASGGPREVTDVTCALRDGTGNTPPETCFLVQGSRARVNFTDDHAEMNGAQDNWHVTQGARASFAGIEGSNTAGIVVHCTSTAQACAGFNILAQGTASASVDRCQASATAWQDDRVGGKTLKGCIDGFVGTDGFFRDLQLSPMTFAQLTGFITCAALTEGYEASVTDDNTALAFNATITGGGTNHVHAYCNGTNWVMQ